MHIQADILRAINAGRSFRWGLRRTPKPYSPRGGPAQRSTDDMIVGILEVVRRLDQDANAPKHVFSNSFVNQASTPSPLSFLLDPTHMAQAEAEQRLRGRANQELINALRESLEQFKHSKEEPPERSR
jgi:hypothetical protein